MSDYSSLQTDDDELEAAKPKLRLRRQSRWEETPVDAPDSAESEAPCPPAPSAAPIDAAEISRQASGGQASYIELEYGSDTWSYFGVWLSNWALILGSGGLLFPWAIARSKSHFYRSVHLDGEAFAFDAHPLKACLLSALIYLFALAAVAVWSFEPFADSQWAAIGLLSMAALTVPALAHEIVRSNTEAISYRGVPLAFTGDLLAAFKNYFLIPLAAIGALGYIALSSSQLISVASLFFWLSLIAYSHRSYKIKNLRFGLKRLKFAGSFKEFQRIYKAPLWCWAGFHAVIAGSIYGLIRFEILTAEDLATLSNPDAGAQLSGEFTLAAIALGLVAGELLWTWWSQIYIKIRSNTYYLERIELEGATLIDAYTAKGYFLLRLSNLLIKLLSLGWLTPYTVVREHRYLITNLAIIAHPTTLDRICRVAGGEKPNETCSAN